MNRPLVSVNLIVRNGEKYLRQSLAAVIAQDYPNFEILAFDNYSLDNTREIIKKEFPQVRLVEFDKNYGLGGGFNRSLNYSRGKYIMCLCVDVFLAGDFISQVVRIAEGDAQIGVVQAKVFQYDFERKTATDIIDTTGFQIFRSRRIINRGHGQEDRGQYFQSGEVFSYEGAVPFFRREALETAKINGEILDEDFSWYADDIDLGWRLRLLGWKSFYSPTVVAYHDRQTTKRLSKNYLDFILSRRRLPIIKRKLDYWNQRLAFIKNEQISHFLRDLLPFLWREIRLFIYLLFFEPGTLLGCARFLKLLPKMLRKRKSIMTRRKIGWNKMRKWFK